MLILLVILTLLVFIVTIFLSVNNILKLILLTIFILPLQQAFTIQIGATLRISDLLFIVIFISILISFMYNKNNIIPLFNNITNLYLVYVVIGASISSAIFSNQITLGLATLPLVSNRLAVNLAQVILSIMIVTTGYYITKFNSNDFFNRIIKFWAIALSITSLYIIIQFIALNTVGFWISLPGEIVHEGATYAYGLRRPNGFFIEPGDAGRFLVVSLLIIMIFLQSSKLKSYTIGICVVAILSTLSSVAIYGLLSIIIVQIFLNKKIGILIKMSFLLVITGFILVSFSNDYLYQATIGKVTTDNFSKVDRLNNGVILMKMFEANPLLGIGYGNFGALRNIYGQGTNIPYKDFYDTPNILPQGTLGEQGIIGGILLITLLFKLYHQLKRIGKQPYLFIIPLIVVYFTSGSIIFNYVMLSFGMIFGISTLETSSRNRLD